MFAGEAIGILWLCGVFWERSDCLALLHSFPSSLMTEQIKRYFWTEVLPRGSSFRMPLYLLAMKPRGNSRQPSVAFFGPSQAGQESPWACHHPISLSLLYGSVVIKMQGENFQYPLGDIIPGTEGSGWGGCSNEPCRDNPCLLREMLQSPNPPCCPPPHSLR